MTNEEKKDTVMVQLVCQVPAEMKADLFLYAEVNDMSMAQVIRKALREFFHDDRGNTYLRYTQKGTGHTAYIPKNEQPPDMGRMKNS